MLTVKNLTKVFGGFTAVSSVDFSVEKGEILGLIGPNGSGKSTIFNMLSGVHFQQRVLLILIIKNCQDYIPMSYVIWE